MLLDTEQQVNLLPGQITKFYSDFTAGEMYLSLIIEYLKNLVHSEEPLLKGNHSERLLQTPLPVKRYNDIFRRCQSLCNKKCAEFTHSIFPEMNELGAFGATSWSVIY